MSLPMNAAPAGLGGAAGAAQTTTVHERIGGRLADLLATSAGRTQYAEYLSRLELDGYGACPHMAAYITRSRALLAAQGVRHSHG